MRIRVLVVAAVAVGLAACSDDAKPSVRVLRRTLTDAGDPTWTIVREIRPFGEDAREVAMATQASDEALTIVVAATVARATVLRTFDGISGNQLAEATAEGSPREALAALDGFEVADDLASVPVEGGTLVVRGGAGDVRVERPGFVDAFAPYNPSFTGGISVAAGDVDGDGKADIITGAGPGGGPHVKIFDASGASLESFYAFDPAYTAGVYVASGNGAVIVSRGVWTKP